MLTILACIDGNTLDDIPDGVGASDRLVLLELFLCLESGKALADCMLNCFFPCYLSIGSDYWPPS